MKKIVFVFFIFFSIYVLNYKYSKQPNLVLSFGNIDAEYNYKYNDTRITDIINDINNNKKINNRPIQNILIKATYIYIDLNNLIKCNNYNSCIKNIDDLEMLIALIRKYSKEKIIIKYLASNNDIDDYTNQKIMVRFKKYDIIYMR